MTLTTTKEMHMMNELGSALVGYRLNNPVSTNTSEHPSLVRGGSKSVGYLQREPGRHPHIRSTRVAVVR